jgi:hypothetical protein
VHNVGMVREAVIHEVAKLIYKAYRGKCIALSEVAEFVKKNGLEASYSLIRFAVELLAKDGKVKKVKLYRFYTIYCIGKEPKMADFIDAKKIEDCINKFTKSFTLMQVAECALGHKPVGSPVLIYTVILYVLTRMVREERIQSFTVLTDARNRLKVVIQR